MLFFQPAVQGFVNPTSFSGIYSEDDYVNDMASRAAHDYALAHAHVQAIERQRDHYHHHPHHHQHHPGGLYGGRLVPASLDNFSYGFSPASARPVVSPPNRHASVDPFEELAYSILQEEGRQRALNRRLEAIGRQRELAREREAQRRRALAVAAAREQARAAHAARFKARQARDEELLLTLMGQLGLAVAPAQSAPVAPQVNLGQHPLMFIHPETHAAPVPAPLPLPVNRKGKAKAVDAPVKIRAAISRPAPVPAKVPILEEELRTRICTETDPEVRESLFSLYFDLFDARKPAQPVAGPSGRKHVSFEIPISGPSSSSPASSFPLPVPVKVEGKIDPTSSSPSAPATKTESTARKSDGAHLHRTPPALPPAVAAKLLKFYRARRARRLSLGQIKDVEDALRQLEGAFEFPAQLDFADRSPSPSPSPAHSELGSDGETASLAYTANNIPVRAYEHALTELLARLDAVESNGDLEVRGRRKEVVKEVERALEAMERRIEESRERSLERATRRRGSVSSQVSDASVTVTPYNVHSSDNVDEVEVAVAAEDVPVKVKDEVVEVLAEVEEPETTSDVDSEDASALTAEDTALQVEAVESAPATTQDVLELNIDIAEPELPQLAVGIPDSGADTNAPSSSGRSIHDDPSSPIDDAEDVNPPFGLHSPLGNSSAPRLVSSTLKEAPATLRDADARLVVEREHVGTPGSDVQPEVVAAGVTSAAPELEASTGTSWPRDGNTLPTLHGVVAPEPITLDESSATDAALVAAVLLMASSSPGDDEVEIISEDEVEPARDGPGSDWSDVGSESCL